MVLTVIGIFWAVIGLGTFYFNVKKRRLTWGDWPTDLEDWYYCLICLFMCLVLWPLVLIGKLPATILNGVLLMATTSITKEQIDKWVKKISVAFENASTIEEREILYEVGQEIQAIEHQKLKNKFILISIKELEDWNERLKDVYDLGLSIGQRNKLWALSKDICTSMERPIVDGLYANIQKIEAEEKIV